SPLANYQVPNSLNVIVTSGDGSQVYDTFNDLNQNTGEALQRVVFTNDGTHGTNNFALSFRLQSGPAPTLLKWVRFDTNAAAEYQGGSTIFGHAAAPLALTIGAASASNPAQLESDSSRGGVVLAFDDQGHRLPAPRLNPNKPELVGPDAVQTTN